MCEQTTQPQTARKINVHCLLSAANGYESFLELGSCQMLAETVRDCLTRSMKRNHTGAEISQVLLSSSVSCRCDESLWSRVPSSHSSGWAEYPHAAGYTGGLELVIGS